MMNANPRRNPKKAWPQTAQKSQKGEGKWQKANIAKAFPLFVSFCASCGQSAWFSGRENFRTVFEFSKDVSLA
mgnify:CR=1 FL=1